MIDQPVSEGLDQAAEELYALPPEEFMPRRTALVAEARGRKDRGLAREIAALRKPILAAWLVNATVRAEPAELAELRSVAQRLRSAQRELRGAELRGLSAERQQVLGAVVHRVDTIASAAGQVITDPVRQQVRETFEAAIADPAAEAAVLSGRLTTALSYSGFGEVDLTHAVSVPPRRAGRLRPVPDRSELVGGRETPEADTADTAEADTAEADTAEADTAAREAAERDAADRALLRAASAEATTAAARARMRQSAAEQAQARAAETVRRLEGELSSAQQRLAASEQALKSASETYSRAEEARRRARLAAGESGGRD
ncbi:hypothetical protein BH10ACT8_BH10ACT8_17330 [soil metagenome]